MAYAKGGYPVEAASKIGHLKIVGSPSIRALVESLEATTRTGPSLIAQYIDKVDLAHEHDRYGFDLPSGNAGRTSGRCLHPKCQPHAS